MVDEDEESKGDPAIEFEDPDEMQLLEVLEEEGEDEIEVLGALLGEQKPERPKKSRPLMRLESITTNKS